MLPHACPPRRLCPLRVSILPRAAPPPAPSQRAAPARHGLPSSFTGPDRESEWRGGAATCRGKPGPSRAGARPDVAWGGIEPAFRNFTIKKVSCHLCLPTWKTRKLEVPF